MLLIHEEEKEEMEDKRGEERYGIHNPSLCDAHKGTIDLVNLGGANIQGNL